MRGKRQKERKNRFDSKNRRYATESSVRLRLLHSKTQLYRKPRKGTVLTAIIRDTPYTVNRPSVLHCVLKILCMLLPRSSFSTYKTRRSFCLIRGIVQSRVLTTSMTFNKRNVLKVFEHLQKTSCFLIFSSFFVFMAL